MCRLTIVCLAQMSWTIIRLQLVAHGKLQALGRACQQDRGRTHLQVQQNFIAVVSLPELLFEGQAGL